jgi:hypothetical protein
VDSYQAASVIRIHLLYNCSLPPTLLNICTKKHVIQRVNKDVLFTRQLVLQVLPGRCFAISISNYRFAALYLYVQVISLHNHMHGPLCLQATCKTVMLRGTSMTKLPIKFRAYRNRLY